MELAAGFRQVLGPDTHLGVETHDPKSDPIAK
jgi:hypothetical protein